MENLGPKDHRERIAIFRSQLIGPLLHREWEHGELVEQLREIAQLRVRPPDSDTTRTYSIPTLERWYYAWKAGGLEALKPLRRSDSGYAQELSDDIRELLCQIRREHPSASAELILRTLQEQGQSTHDVSPSTIRRLFESRGLDRVSLRQASTGRERLRWEASHPGALLHGDVCHLTGRDLGKLYIHGQLDDASRYVPALEERETEREVEMLSLTVGTFRRCGRWDAFYLDNGSTYSGQILATACARLGVTLIHARPHDPQARGKMERFWRTLREGLLDHLDPALPRAEVRRRLDLFRERYNTTPHASLMGRTPQAVWEGRRLRSIAEEELARALTTREQRLVTRDGVVSVAGQLFEVHQSFLAGHRVQIAHCLIPGLPELICAEHDGKRYPLARLNRPANGRVRRYSVSPDPRGPAVPFQPHSRKTNRDSGET